MFKSVKVKGRRTTIGAITKYASSVLLITESMMSQEGLLFTLHFFIFWLYLQIKQTETSNTTRSGKQPSKLN